MAADGDTAARTAGPRKRMQVFRFSEGRELTPESMPFEGVDESVMAGFARLMQAGAADAHAEKTAVLFKEPGENGLSLTYAWFKSGYVLPRHSHDADCVYYVLAGELTMGNQTLRKGDGIFVPANAGYSYEVGPEGVEVLEFRNATKFNILFKDNDEAHWDRMVEVYKNKAGAWADEPAPSER